MASGNNKAAPKRRVLVTLELETDMPVSLLRESFRKGGHGSSSTGFVIKQAQFNVVKPGPKR